MKHGKLVMISNLITFSLVADNCPTLAMKREHYRLMLQRPATVIYRVKADQTVGLSHMSI